MKRPLSFFIFLLVTTASFSQGVLIPLGNDAYQIIDRLDVKYGTILPATFTADKGYEKDKVAKWAETLLLSNLKLSTLETAQLHYLTDEASHWLDSAKSATPHPVTKNLYTRPAYFYDYSSKKKGVFDISFNPVLGASVSGESAAGGRLLYSGTAGAEVQGDIKKVLSFYINATENTDRNPYYVARLNTPGVLPYAAGNLSFPYQPGVGFYSVYNAKPLNWAGIDYFDLRGYVKAKILKYITLSFGRDKFFIGDGQRSLILSDYAAPYLFFKFDIGYWKFNYENIFAQLNTEYLYNRNSGLSPKYMAVHHLTFDFTKWLTMGVYETVIFQRSTPELSYLNPLIFYKAVEASLGNPDKVSIGGDFKMNFIGHLQFYSQVIFNEFNFSNFFSRNGWWGNKWGFQFGTKYIDVAPGFDIQAEFNIVRPFTYSADGGDNFTNFNQPLADPLGAGFYEVIFNLHYQPLTKWQFNLKYSIAKVTTDTLINGVMSNYGGNILLSNGTGIDNATAYLTQQYNNRFAQGGAGTINYVEFLTTYQLWHNINLDGSILARGFSTIKSSNNPNPSQFTFLFSLGIRVNLARKNYQF